ncbi:hypothetical protein [Streptomyces sp. GZWMJZ-114]|uniref:hypothetical protein n=1 Tax=Streptomyces sp. GZWMJZ-114 TaxID=2494734 RepID=UPI0010136BA0|nr:hypothetical protein [Streptomyces sp. GZWMJZ-114]
MKCRRFDTLRAEFEREIAYFSGHSARNRGTSAGKASATHAIDARRNMARALSTHTERCPECC